MWCEMISYDMQYVQRERHHSKFTCDVLYGHVEWPIDLNFFYSYSVSANVHQLSSDSVNLKKNKIQGKTRRWCHFTFTEIKFIAIRMNKQTEKMLRSKAMHCSRLAPIIQFNPTLGFYTSSERLKFGERKNRDRNRHTDG